MEQALRSARSQVVGRSFTRVRDSVQITSDTALAICTVVYLLAMLVVVAWQLFDTWIGAYSLPAWLGYDRARMDTPSFRLIAYTVIGGALGSLVNGIRSFLIHHHAFAGRYVWKYITAPWMGAALALLVYALIHSSTAVFAGNGETSSGSTQALANFAAGALAGYGAKDVFIWLDAQVQKLFKVEQPTPDVQGQAPATAAATLHTHDQAVGNVSTVAPHTGTQPGTVVAQTPPPGTPIPRGEEVNLTVTGDAPGHDTPSEA
ncbi:MAG TPA: PASTA domain-containing protein [Herpetosiphonaceae bacterium]